MLAFAERTFTRLSLHYCSTYLLLCLPSQESGLLISNGLSFTCQDVISDFSKQNVVAKSGYLSKSGKRNPKYNRYWFRLKGDILSYYRDSANLYFPHGQIDLRFGISASVTDRDKDGLHFSIVTSTRTYNFRADSAPSAKEWVKSLQRVIFRSHNDGDSVKISLPIKNIIDVEDTQMVEFSDTCKIRVIDNDETYAIDEVSELTCVVYIILLTCCKTVLLLFFLFRQRGHQCLEDSCGRHQF